MAELDFLGNYWSVRLSTRYDKAAQLKGTALFLMNEKSSGFSLK